VNRAGLARLALVVVFGVAAGAAFGVGGYAFVYARGASYLTDDPAACANCHVMQAEHDGWQKSSHHGVAVCNDCHTPAGFFGKYATKASNGFWHSYYFTTGGFPEPIELRPGSRAILEARCHGCHGQIVDAMAGPHHGEDAVACVRCHADVGHWTR